MKFLTTLFLTTLFSFSLIAQVRELKSYQLYNKKGKEINWRKTVKQLEKADIILFGELHNNAIAHWLELEVTKALVGENKSITLGFEMLETPCGGYINLIENLKNSEKLSAIGCNLWPNFETDYLPIIEFGLKNDCNISATNAPRRISLQVYKSSLKAVMDTISEQDKLLIFSDEFPIDTNLQAYKDIRSMAMGHNADGLLEAQALKDVTMARRIIRDLKEYLDDDLTNNRRRQYIHLNGNYHTDNFESIYWYLKWIDPSLSIVTISTVEQENIDQLSEEHLGKANIIIAVDADMTHTY